MKTFCTFALVFCAMVALSMAVPVPQRLTEKDFIDFDDSNEGNRQNKIAVVSGYARIRQQGRHGRGRSLSFGTNPSSVRNPYTFARSLPSRTHINKINQYPEMAPVYRVSDMLKKEAKSLKIKVEEASLKAVEAAEEAEKKVKELAEQTVKQEVAEAIQVEKIIKATIADAEERVKEVVEAEETATEKADVDNHDDELVVVEEEEDIVATTTSSPSQQPSSDIDLGSVQEV